MLVGNNDNEGGLWDALFGGALPPEQVAVFNNLFTCGSASAAAVRFQNSVKSWRYRYYGVWPNLAISEDAGAYHSSEIPQIFGNAARLSGVADTPEENIVGDTMRHAWAEFAKDPDNGLVTLGWPVYDPAGKFCFTIV